MIRLRAYSWVACVCFIAASICCVATATMATSDALMQLKRTDNNMYNSVMDLRMHTTELLCERVLADVSGPGSPVRIERIDKWRSTPLSLTARVPEGDLRIRNESDFVIIWIRRDAAVPNSGSSLDVIRRATENILAETYQPGPADRVAAVDVPANEGQEIRLLSNASTLPGTTAILCSYTNVSAKTRRWKYVSNIHVLVKGRDVVIVCEKAKARRAGSPYAYEGLLAAKTRLSETEKKDAADQALLAGNAIFEEGADLAKLPSKLLNGCMWPLAGYAKTDVGSAHLLQKMEKPISTPVESSSRRQVKEIEK